MRIPSSQQMGLTPVRNEPLSFDRISCELTLSNCLTPSNIKEGEDFISWTLHPLFFKEKERVDPQFGSFENELIIADRGELYLLRKYLSPFFQLN